MLQNTGSNSKNINMNDHEKKNLITTLNRLFNINSITMEWIK